jgi:hypothetical protein
MTKPYNHTREGRTVRYVGWALGIGAVLIILYAIFWPQRALSQNNLRCAPYADIAKELASQYQEYPTAAATSGRGSLAVELWKTSDGETWTLIAIQKDGMACIVAGGNDWKFHILRLPGKRT